MLFSFNKGQKSTNSKKDRRGVNHNTSEFPFKGWTSLELIVILVYEIPHRWFRKSWD